MNYYYLVNGQRVELEHICYSTTTGEYYGRPSETWVVGTQPGHTRRSVLLRPADCDAYHLITEQELYCKIEAAHRILAEYDEDNISLQPWIKPLLRDLRRAVYEEDNQSFQPWLKPMLRDLRRHVHLLYLLAGGDPAINWTDVAQEVGS